MGRTSTEGKAAICKPPGGKPGAQLSTSAFEGVQACPHLDLGLLASGPVSKTLLLLKAPGLWGFAKAAPGNSYPGVGV